MPSFKGITKEPHATLLSAKAAQESASTKPSLKSLSSDSPLNANYNSPLQYSTRNLLFLFGFGNPSLFEQTFLNLGKPQIDCNLLIGNVNCQTAFLAEGFWGFLGWLEHKNVQKSLVGRFFSKL
jgi:hypothetical protein